MQQISSNLTNYNVFLFTIFIQTYNDLIIKKTNHKTVKDLKTHKHIQEINIKKMLKF